MLLILGDARLEFRHFPHLMAEGFGVASCQRGRTAPASTGPQGHDVVAVFRGDQLALMSRMPRLTTPFSLRAFLLLPRRLGVRVLTTGWQRRVLGTQGQSGFQLFDPAQQRCHKRPNRRRHLGVDFRRNEDRLDRRGRHNNLCRRRKRRPCPDQFLAQPAPGLTAHKPGALTTGQGVPQPVVRDVATGQSMTFPPAVGRWASSATRWPFAVARCRLVRSCPPIVVGRWPPAIARCSALTGRPPRAAGTQSSAVSPARPPLRQRPFVIGRPPPVVRCWSRNINTTWPTAKAPGYRAVTPRGVNGCRRCDDVLDVFWRETFLALPPPPPWPARRGCAARLAGQGGGGSLVG